MHHYFCWQLEETCNAGVPLASQQCVCIHRSFFLDTLPRFSTVTCLHLTTISFYSIKARMDVWTYLPIPSSSWTGNRCLGWYYRVKLEDGFGELTPGQKKRNSDRTSLLQHLKYYHATNQTGNTDGFPLFFICVDSSISTKENPGNCSCLHQHSKKLPPSCHFAHRKLGKLSFIGTSTCLSKLVVIGQFLMVGRKMRETGIWIYTHKGTGSTIS